jgi:hypothetical protein
MAYIGNREFLIEVAKGNIAGHSIIHKFGKNISTNTSFTPVSVGGIYQTPQTGSATTLRIKSGGNANDTAAGSGARKVMLEGIDETGAIVTEELTTAGASASSTTTTTFIRLYRAYVSESGTYGTSSTGSHSGAIVIENGGGGTDWAEISVTNYPKAQTEIGVYTIPNGYTGYLINAFGFTDSSKTTELIFFKRTGILDTSAPYDAVRIVFEERVEGGEFKVDPKAPILLGTACDCGFMAKVGTGSAEVDVDFEILLIEN